MSRAMLFRLHITGDAFLPPCCPSTQARAVLHYGDTRSATAPSVLLPQRQCRPPACQLPRAGCPPAATEATPPNMRADTRLWAGPGAPAPLGSVRRLVGSGLRQAGPAPSVTRRATGLIGQAEPPRVYPPGGRLGRAADACIGVDQAPAHLLATPSLPHCLFLCRKRGPQARGRRAASASRASVRVAWRLRFRAGGVPAVTAACHKSAVHRALPARCPRSRGFADGDHSIGARRNSRPIGAPCSSTVRLTTGAFGLGLDATA